MIKPKFLHVALRLNQSHHLFMHVVNTNLDMFHVLMLNWIGEQINNVNRQLGDQKGQ